MLIDSSGSQMRVLDMEKEVGASFLESTLRPKDEAFVIAFDVDITLLQDFTNSVSRLRHALNEAKINTGGVGCSGGPIGPQGPIPCGSPGHAAPRSMTPSISRRTTNSATKSDARR